MYIRCHQCKRMWKEGTYKKWTKKIADWGMMSYNVVEICPHCKSAKIERSKTTWRALWTEIEE